MPSIMVRHKIKKETKMAGLVVTFTDKRRGRNWKIIKNYNYISVAVVAKTKLGQNLITFFWERVYKMDSNKFIWLFVCRSHDYDPNLPT